MKDIKFVSDIERQKMIVRQSSLKMAVELLNNEQERGKSEAKIPIESIKNIAKELEEFVWEHCNEKKEDLIKEPKTEEVVI